MLTLKENFSDPSSRGRSPCSLVYYLVGWGNSAFGWKSRATMTQLNSWTYKATIKGHCTDGLVGL